MLDAGSSRASSTPPTSSSARPRGPSSSDRGAPAGRIVFDGLAEIRLLAQGALRYRRQVLALKHYFAKHGATVLLLDDMSAPEHDLQLHSVAHGVLRLEQLTPAYGPERRRLSVTKYRGAQVPGRLPRLHHQPPAGCSCTRDSSRRSSGARRRARR
jgi:KaiC/GvpD/RAD55 family RecA-like ATPase